mgnify:CR=1 FL=1
MAMAIMIVMVMMPSPAHRSCARLGGHGGAVPGGHGAADRVGKTGLVVLVQEISVVDVDGGEMGTDVMLNGSCPDDEITDQLWYFHEWGSYTIQFPADSNPDEIWFVAIQE